MRSIDVKEATPFRNLQKFGIGQGHGCENGLIENVYLVSASDTGKLV